MTWYESLLDNVSCFLLKLNIQIRIRFSSTAASWGLKARGLGASFFCVTTCWCLKPLILRYVVGWIARLCLSQPLVVSWNPWYFVMSLVESLDYVCLNHWSSPETLDAALGRWLDRSTMSVSTTGRLLKPLILRWAVGWIARLCLSQPTGTSWNPWYCVGLLVEARRFGPATI